MHEPLLVQSLHQPHLLVLRKLLEQVGQAVVLQRLREHAPAAEWEVANRSRHLGRMKPTQRRGLAVDRALVGEQLAGLAPVDDVGRAPAPRQTATPHRDGRDLPRERLGRRDDAHVHDAAASQPPAHQLSIEQPLAGPQLELAQIDRPATQPHALAGDLSDPARADEDAAPPHADDEAVHARGPAAEVDHDVGHVTHVRAVGRHQRQPEQP